MNVIWINGWGLSADYVLRIARRRYPDSRHFVVNPDSRWTERLARFPGRSTIVGYSLGAFLLLGRPEIGARFQRSVLLAPFVDFRKEADLGGRTRAGQLRYLLRWIKRDRLSAWQDFKRRAGIREAEYPEELSLESLSWGLYRLLKSAVDPGALRRAECWIGAADTLLDAEALGRVCEHLKVIPGAGHDLDELVREARLRL